MKGLILDPSALHLCYCHTPGRYIWDAYSEFRSNLPPIFRPFFTAAAHYVRNWDFSSAQRVDHFIANSKYVSQRIWKYYRRQSTVIYPPIETAMGYLSETRDDYYLSVGRLVESKRIDLLIHACNKLGKRLLIAGTGREENKLKALAGPTIEFLGRVPDAKLPELYARSRAFLFAADEDFGIVPVEAQAFGRPVICLGRGGSLETVLGYDRHSQPTGLFFQEQTFQSVCDALLLFEAIEGVFNPKFIQSHARQFDRVVFENRMRHFVDRALQTGEVKSDPYPDLTFTEDLYRLGQSLGRAESPAPLAAEEEFSHVWKSERPR
jgi:glycosyltransferase involved in cell wall biosynthesis